MVMIAKRVNPGLVDGQCFLWIGIHLSLMDPDLGPSHIFTTLIGGLNVKKNKYQYY